jgi:CRP-like cAMP-binding protein
MKISMLPITPVQTPIEVRRRLFARRSLLPLRQDACWQIESGIVRTTATLEDGTLVTLGLWGAGDILGKPLSKIETYQVETLTNVEAVLLPGYNLQAASETILNHIQQTEELLIIRSHKHVDAMLLKLLVWLAHRFGQDVEQGRSIDLRLTHQDIAELLGTTRVTVTRVLKQFEQEGLIQRLTKGRMILREAEFWYYEI